jgi:hypothetical protein
VTKIGRSIVTSACCGYCFHAASLTAGPPARRAAEEPRHLAAQFGQPASRAYDSSSTAERLAVVVVVGAEVVEPGALVAEACRSSTVPTSAHALYSPQLTSRSAR